MKHPRPLICAFTLALISALVATDARAQDAVRISGAVCERPPVLKCPDGGCRGDALPMVIEGGPVVEEETGRNYFLDYPCDLRPGEDVTFVLSLHGGGSYGNWQRHYFPLLDYVDDYRLVVATPFSPRQVWTEEDDEYLRNIVRFVIDELGTENIRAFWLAGHSQGGLTSRRLVCTEFFRDKADGFLSLSGGRLGGQAPISFGRRSDDEDDGGPPGGNGGPPSTPPDPDCDFSHVYTTGELELANGLASLPETSALAQRFECSARERRDDVVDDEGGYVYDSSRQEDPIPAWGRLPGPGHARVYTYPDCSDGRIVADVVRMDKGHTEGLEPNVTEELVRLMVSAEGGKIHGGG